MKDVTKRSKAELLWKGFIFFPLIVSLKFIAQNKSHFHLTPPRLRRSLFEMPLFHAFLAIVGFNEVHILAKSEIEDIVGPSFSPVLSSRHLDSSSVAQFLAPFRKTKGGEASDHLKITLHHVGLPQPDTNTMSWRLRRLRRLSQSARSFMRGERATELLAPWGAVCVHGGSPLQAPEDAAAPDCREVGVKQQLPEKTHHRVRAPMQNSRTVTMRCKEDHKHASAQLTLSVYHHQLQWDAASNAHCQFRQEQ